MKIGLGSQNNIEQTQNTSQPTRAGQTSGGSQSLGSVQYGLDRVDVSSVAQTAASVIGMASDHRAQQVANLTQLYQSGQYTVDPIKLGNAIVEQDMDPSNAH